MGCLQSKPDLVLKKKQHFTMKPDTLGQNSKTSSQSSTKRNSLADKIKEYQNIKRVIGFSPRRARKSTDVPNQKSINKDGPITG